MSTYIDHSNMSAAARANEDFKDDSAMRQQQQVLNSQREQGYVPKEELQQTAEQHFAVPTAISLAAISTIVMSFGASVFFGGMAEQYLFRDDDALANEYNAKVIGHDLRVLRAVTEGATINGVAMTASTPEVFIDGDTRGVIVMNPATYTVLTASLPRDIDVRRIEARFEPTYYAVVDESIEGGDPMAAVADVAAADADATSEADIPATVRSQNDMNKVRQQKRDAMKRKQAKGPRVISHAYRTDNGDLVSFDPFTVDLTMTATGDAVPFEKEVTRKFTCEKEDCTPKEVTAWCKALSPNAVYTPAAGKASTLAARLGGSLCFKGEECGECQWTEYLSSMCFFMEQKSEERLVDSHGHNVPARVARLSDENGSDVDEDPFEAAAAAKENQMNTDGYLVGEHNPIPHYRRRYALSSTTLVGCNYPFDQPTYSVREPSAITFSVRMVEDPHYMASMLTKGTLHVDPPAEPTVPNPLESLPVEEQVAAMIKAQEKRERDYEITSHGGVVVDEEEVRVKSHRLSLMLVGGNLFLVGLALFVLSHAKTILREKFGIDVDRWTQKIMPSDGSRNGDDGVKRNLHEDGSSERDGPMGSSSSMRNRNGTRVANASASMMHESLTSMSVMGGNGSASSTLNRYASSLSGSLLGIGLLGGGAGTKCLPTTRSNAHHNLESISTTCFGGSTMKGAAYHPSEARVRQQQAMDNSHVIPMFASNIIMPATAAPPMMMAAASLSATASTMASPNFSQIPSAYLTHQLPPPHQNQQMYREMPKTAPAPQQQGSNTYAMPQFNTPMSGSSNSTNATNATPSTYANAQQQTQLQQVYQPTKAGYEGDCNASEASQGLSSQAASPLSQFYTGTPLTPQSQQASPIIVTARPPMGTDRAALPPSMFQERY